MGQSGSKTVPDFETGVLRHDQLEGFDGQRKQRVMIATEAEMISAKIPHKYRDYCAHLWIQFETCRKRQAPWYWRCGHVKHEYLTCQFEDDLLRMKEYERERRLLANDAEQERLNRIREERRRQKAHHEEAHHEELHD